MTTLAILILALGGAFTLAITIIAVISWSWNACDEAAFKNRLTSMVRTADIIQPILLLLTIAGVITYSVSTWQSKASPLILVACGMLLLIFVSSVLYILPLQKKIAVMPSDHTKALRGLRRHWMIAHNARAIVAIIAYMLLALSIET